MARLLGLDFGQVRIGVALADDEEGFVITKPAIQHGGTAQAFIDIKDVIAQEHVTKVIVGLPLTLRGGDSAQTQATRAFVLRLRQSLAIPVVLADERLTTQLAHRLGRRTDDDSAAAALLLTTFLEQGRTL